MTWFWPSLLGLNPASCGLTRSRGGIESGFEAIGAGNLAAEKGGRRVGRELRELIRRDEQGDPSLLSS